MIATKSSADLNNIVPGKKLVLFDFDGTITTHDTLAEFMIFYHGKAKYYLGLGILSPILASYVFKLMPNWKSKEYFLSWFLRGEKYTDFESKCRAFAESRLPQLIRPGALEQIEQHQREGATIAVVTASAENWVKPWCDKHNIRCIATRLEASDKKLTGKILGKNCHGEEKVCRIKEQFSLREFDKITAYGDTSGDKQMLDLAHEKFYKPFRHEN